jgi:hypothetical protein
LRDRPALVAQPGQAVQDQPARQHVQADEGQRCARAEAACHYESLARSVATCNCDRAAACVGRQVFTMSVKLRDAGIVKRCETAAIPASSGASSQRCAHRPPGGSPLPPSSACACGRHHKPGSKRRSERMCAVMAIRGPAEPSRGCAGRAQARCGCQQEPGRGQRQSSACVVRPPPRAGRGPDQQAHGPGSRRRRGTGPQPCPQQRTCGGDAPCSHPCWLCCSTRFGAATSLPRARATAHVCVSCGDSAPPRTARGQRQTRDRQCMRPF